LRRRLASAAAQPGGLAEACAPRTCEGEEGDRYLPPKPLELLSLLLPLLGLPCAGVANAAAKTAPVGTRAPAADDDVPPLWLWSGRSATGAKTGGARTASRPRRTLPLLLSLTRSAPNRTANRSSAASAHADKPPPLLPLPSLLMLLLLSPAQPPMFPPSWRRNTISQSSSPRPAARAAASWARGGHAATEATAAEEDERHAPSNLRTHHAVARTRR
jgi:hypothetical protein